MLDRISWMVREQNQGRLYQQNIPKAVDDSDERVSTEPKKRCKYNRCRLVEAPKRQWTLQEQVEFLETMVNRKREIAVDGNKISKSVRTKMCPNTTVGAIPY